ncbi:hypothetical protein MBOT_04000 [Mycobacterium botniense]|uniref:N-acetyltransferase domain-containing protein n=1 Tax=Mycobacterium botniense TaxID=84962 RepID=A0A7I9XSR9_9MYCO|nr:hypothetical protein MBOT_04000 [Mycobacterium botniense]
MSREPGMLVLALDTATAAVTAGIVRVRHAGRAAVLAERVTVDARAHAERLTPNVLAALTDAAVRMADLDGVVVGCGPGPFTGLRVGMATAAAYGHALDIPVRGVCSLDAIGVQTTGETLVVTDARRREVYWARYRDGVRVGGPAVSAPAAVDAGAASAVAGSPEHAALFGLPWCGPAYPTPTGLVAAVADWSARPAALVPLYLRRPDATSLQERQAARRRRGAPTSPTAREPVVPVSIDALTPADAERCAQLEAQLFDGDDPWPREAFLREIASVNNRYVGARIGDVLVGYAGISRLGRTAPFEYEVHTIGVDKAYQGRGIGRRLLEELLNVAGDAAVYLEVRTDNAPAIELYRSAGFTAVGVRRRYYRASGADAYTMRREARR